MKHPSRPTQFWRWFDPRSRSISTYGFILNRITALGLTLYLFIHLIVLSKLAQGPQAYQEFLEFAHHPAVLVGELLVIAAGFIHGLNGIRIALNSFGLLVRWQKPIFLGVMAVSIIGTLVFAIKMFGS